MTSRGELLDRAVGGERAALVELLERHGPTVAERVARKLPHRWRSVLSTEDVMQESYTEVILEIGRSGPRDERSFAAWLATIAERNLIDAVRMLEAEKRGGGRRHIHAPVSDISQVAFGDKLADGGPTPSRDAATQEARVSIERAMEKLPERYRKVIQMYDLEGRTIEETAKALDRSPGAVFMLRARAHRCLSDLMGRESKFFSDSP